MDYNDVVVFSRVVEKGTFTSAAEALGLPKSSVSRSVTRLEEDLGVRLLQRTTRRVALTDAGERFFERARSALAGLDEAADTVREFGTDPRGLVRVTAPPDAFAIGLAEAVTEFTQRYPKIQIDLNLTGRTVDLVGEGFDLAVRAGRLSDSTLIARKVGTTDLLLFAAPSYLDAHGRPAKLAELARHDCVLFRTRSGHASWQLTGPDGEESVTVTGRVSADDLLFIARAAAAGAGIALLPLPAARLLVETDSIESVLPEYRTTGGALSVVLPSSVFVPSRVALLRDFLVDFLGKRLTDLERRCTEHRRTRTRRA